MTTPSYSERIEQLAQRYDPRIMAILERLRDELHAAGYQTVEPYRMFDDNYRWAFATKNAHGYVGEGSIDFMVEIAEQRDYEGQDADPGINFGLGITRYGGVVVGGFQPFNYTPQVWVNCNDDITIEERFALFETADTSDVVALLA